MSDIICPKCNSVNDFYTELKANNNVARCNKCDAFIKNISYDKPKMYIGKYKGVAIEDIRDLQYLKWAISKMETIGKTLRDAIQSQIYRLETESK